jgi:hypothetical protein
MEKTGMSFEEVLAALDPQTRAQVKRGSEADLDPPGYLTPRDVCRLFGGPEWSEPWTDGPTSKARELIAQKQLPLLEVSPGRWQVAHTVSQ